jgi:pilus assembly protein Flp/PilA
MRTRIRRGRKLVHDRGASAVEYGLMVAAIVAIVVGIVFGLGGVISGVFSDTCDTLATRTQQITIPCEKPGN